MIEIAMKKALILALALPFVLTGCGGDSVSQAVASLFAGIWSGPWNSQSAQVQGNTTVTIDSDGDFAGPWNNTTLNASGTISGSIQNNGDFSGTVKFPGEPDQTVTGNLGLNNQGQIEGSGTGVVGQQTFDVSFTLTKQ